MHPNSLEFGPDLRIFSFAKRGGLTPAQGRKAYVIEAKPITATHFYRVEKNGILFPSLSEIRVEYTGLVRPQKDTKAKIEIHYENYRFFTVETENKIIR